MTDLSDTSQFPPLRDTMTSQRPVGSTITPPSPDVSTDIPRDFLPNSTDFKLTSASDWSAWSATVRNTLYSRELLGHLTVDPPASGSSEERLWHRRDIRVAGYLVESVHQSLRADLVTRSARDVWTSLSTRYLESSGTREYSLLTQASSARQGDRSIQDFYLVMRDFWRELEGFIPPSFLTEIGRTFWDRRHMYEFLMALRPEFSALVGQLIHRHPTPTLETAVADLTSEETRFRTLGSVPSAPSSFSGVLAAASPSSSSTFTGRLSCSHCLKSGHLVDSCWKLHPELRVGPRGRGRRVSPAVAVVAPTPTPAAPAAFISSQITPEHQRLFQQFQQFQQSQSQQSQSHYPSPGSISASSATGMPHSWIFDSGATDHMTPDVSILTDTRSTPDVSSIYLADGSHLPITRCGTITTTSEPSGRLSLSSVLHAPHLSMNLLSVGRICDYGYRVLFTSSSCSVQDPSTGRVIGLGRRDRDLYHLQYLHLPSTRPSFCGAASSVDLWHRRLGHISESRLKSLFLSGALGHSSFSTLSPCTSCKLAKATALPFTTRVSLTHSAFDLVHSDIWGPAPISSMCGYRYYVSFIDDFTRYTWVYLLKQRSEILSIYDRFTTMIFTQFGRRIKTFRSDCALEYLSSGMRTLISSHGTLFQHSCPHTHEQNGVAERKHRHILETTRSLLLSASVPRSFWAEAVLTSVRLINMSPSSVLPGGISSHERLFSSPPDYSSLRTFGCTCFVLLPPSDRSKLSAVSVRCVLLGLSVEHKGYRCYDPSSRRMFISRHVTFLEDTPYFPSPPQDLTFLELPPLSSPTTPSPPPSPVELSLAPLPHALAPTELASPPPPSADLPPSDPHTPFPLHYMRRSPDLDYVPSESTSSDSSPSSTTESDASASPDPPPPRYPQREHHPPVRFGYSPDRYGYLSTTSYTAPFSAFLTAIHTDTEPTSFREASCFPEWQQAMAEEFEAFRQTETWDVVPLPTGVQPITCKWIYKIKRQSDGSIDRYKARLVARGFSQEYGIDYDETFAPVARLDTVRTLLAVASVRQWPLHQMDVKNAFLHGDLSEVVYMQPPPGLQTPPQHVCRLRRALYGLKQAPRAWFDRFRQAVTEAGFVESTQDHSMFIRTSDQGRAILLLYVDDMIITGDDTAAIQSLQSHLRRQFQMKDLGPLRYFLGLEVARSERGILLSQQKYLSDILTRSALTDTRTADTPLELHVKLRPSDGEPLSDPTRYRQIVGQLVYLCTTRPDISHAVSIVSQFVSAPRSVHYAALIRILRYLRGTMTRSLLLSSSSALSLRAFSDADWAGDPTTRRSTTGFCVFLGDSLISWRSKKQVVVSLSSTEAEYRAMRDTAKEITALRLLLLDMGVPLTGPTPMYCDNQSAIHIASNPVFHERTKHIEIDCHYVRQQFVARVISLPYMSSAEQLADFFTKSHTFARQQFLIGKLSVFDPP